jgi:CRISPR/Cas system-associated exonuclease Cas4 (RecB family)
MISVTGNTWDTVSHVEPTAAASPPARDYVSFSAIRTYQTCPLKYYFRYVAGIPEETVSASLVFGGAIHAAVEQHFRELLAGNSPPTLEELREVYCTEWNLRSTEVVQFGQGEGRDSLDKLSSQMLEAFQRSDAAQPPGRILGVEETLRGPIIAGLPEILGRLDLLSETEDSLIISDWKTSRSRWSTTQFEDAAEQLILYTELAQDISPGKPFQVEFVVITKTTKPAIQRERLPVTPPQVARVRHVVQRVWTAITAEHFYPAPSAMACGGCPYRTQCRAWAG